MLKKEFFDSINKTMHALGILFISLLTGYVFILISGAFKVSFNQFLCITIELLFLFISFYLGASTFGEEKKQNTFEYLLSLPCSRSKLLLNKILPRLAILVILLIPYFLFTLLIASDPLLLKPKIFLLLFFTVFILSVCVSLARGETRISFNYLIILTCIGLIFVFTNFVLFLEIILYSKGLDSIILDIRQLSLTGFILFTLFLFGCFILSFRKTDLGNIFIRFQKVFLHRIFFVLGGCLVVFLLLNAFDTGEVKLFSEKDLLPARLGKSNGYIKFLALLENPEVDINSDEIHRKYFNILRPPLDPRNLDPFEKRKASRRKLKKTINLLAASRSNWHKMLVKFGIDKGNNFFDDSNEKVLKLLGQSKLIKIYLDRYQKLLEHDYIRDISISDSYAFFRGFRQITILSKIYTLGNLVHADQQDQIRGLKNIFKQINFIYKLCRGSRAFYSVWFGRISLYQLLSSLEEWMNQEHLPKETLRFILQKLKEPKQKLFNLENTRIFDGLLNQQQFSREIADRANSNIISKAVINLFTHENRTLNHIYELTKTRIMLDKLMPLKAKAEVDQRKLSARTNDKILWWVFNPVGKSFINHYRLDRYWLTYWKYHLKAQHDLTRITAEALLKYHPGIKNLENFIKSLDSYKELIDPFSGKPYKFNPKENTIYSFGRNLKDDQGKLEHKDIIVKLKLSNKKESSTIKKD